MGIRPSDNCLIFTMGTYLLVRQCFYIETAQAQLGNDMWCKYILYFLKTTEYVNG